MPAEPLTACEREEIRAGIERGESLSEIASGLGRHRCTISREVNRNGGRGAYVALVAQRRAQCCRARPKVPKLVADPGLRAHVARRLRAKDSPKTISLELARGVRGPGGSISHECIYQAIYRPDRGLTAGLHRGLHLRRRRRKHRRRPAPGSHSLGSFTPISARPPAAAARVEVGHLEGDLIVGAYNRSALITIFDRASRHLWLAPVASKTSDDTFVSLCRTLQRIPPALRRTLTWDQGAEMARHRDLAQHVGIDIYIADAHSPWQRPTNENGNALIRRYVGKGTNLNTYTPKQLRRIEHRINTIPRRSLNWTTAHHTYTHAVAMTD